MIKGKPLRDPGILIFRITFIIIAILFLAILILLGKKSIRCPLPRTLVIYCFSGMQEVMENGIFPAFQDYWFKKNGEKLEYIPTFFGSGEITNKILKKFPAEVAILSSNLDAWRLSICGIPASQWQQDLPYKGIIGRTPLIMLTRRDNPKAIVEFSDLAEPGIKIVYPNPLTSGAGQWGIVSIYGSMLHQNNNEMKVLQLIRSITNNIIEQPSSAREALLKFIQDRGDVLIAYESNILMNPMREQIPGQLVYPPSTVICEPVALAVQKNITSKQKDLVDHFIQFLWSKEAQEIFVQYGFHSVAEELSLDREDFGNIQDPFTINSIGSYRNVKNIIDEIVANQFSSSGDQ